MDKVRLAMIRKIDLPGIHDVKFCAICNRKLPEGGDILVDNQIYCLKYCDNCQNRLQRRLSEMETGFHDQSELYGCPTAASIKKLHPLEDRTVEIVSYL